MLKDKEEKIWVIYKHTNKINGKVYIGMTCNIDTRYGSKEGQGYLHKKKNGEYVQPYFARAILKYGWDNFEHEILKEGLTLKEADELEREYIKEYDSSNPEKGYNIRGGGSHGHLSEETKEKLKQTMEGRYNGEKNPFYGKAHTKEGKDIIAQKASERSKKVDPEVMKERMRKIALAKKNKKEQYEEEKKYKYICVETGEKFNSILEAKEFTGVATRGIRNVIYGKWKTAGGYHWKKELKEEYKESQNN